MTDRPEKQISACRPPTVVFPNKSISPVCHHFQLLFLKIASHLVSVAAAAVGVLLLLPPGGGGRHHRGVELENSKKKYIYI